MCTCSEKKHLITNLFRFKNLSYLQLFTGCCGVTETTARDDVVCYCVLWLEHFTRLLCEMWEEKRNFDFWCGKKNLQLCQPTSLVDFVLHLQPWKEDCIKWPVIPVVLEFLRSYPPSEGENLKLKTFQSSFCSIPCLKKSISWWHFFISKLSYVFLPWNSKCSLLTSGGTQRF